MATYLEILAAPSTNNVQLPSTTLPAGAKEVEFKVRAPSGVTGNVRVFGEEAGTSNVMFLDLTNNRITIVGSGTSNNSSTAIVAGTIYTIKIVWITSPSNQTLIYKDGVLVNTFAYHINFNQPFTRIGSSGSSRTRVDFYWLKITSATLNREWSADGVTSGTVLPELIAASNGTLTNFAGNPWKSEATINTLDNPIPADGAFSGTATGYTAGAATLTTPVIGGGTVSSSVTVAAGTDPKPISGTYPPPVSTQAYPIMGVSHVHTLTQGATAATQGSVVGAPAGYTIVTLNFPVTTNPEYITANLVVTPVTGDLLVYDGADISVDPSGFWTAEDPTVTIVIHQKLSTGVVYIYEFTLGQSGVISGGLLLSGKNITATKISASKLIGSKFR